jgi:hypothetical protein
MQQGRSLLRRPVEGNLVLVEPPGAADALEELPSRSVLHGDGKVSRREDNLRGRRSIQRDIGRRERERVCTARSRHHLLEPDDVGVPQRPVVDDLPLHVLVDLQHEPLSPSPKQRCCLREKRR